MSDRIEKSEIISQLYTVGSTHGKINQLMGEADSLNYNVENEKKDNLSKTAEDLLAFQKKCNAPKAFPSHQVANVKTTVELSVAEKKFTAKNIIIGVSLGFAAIAFFVLFAIASATGLDSGFLASISSLGTLGCVAGWFVYGKNVVAAALEFENENNAYTAELKTVAENVDTISLDAFNSEWDTFDKMFNACVESCRAEHDKALERLAEMDQKVVQKALDRLEVIKSEVNALENELAKYDVIHPAYFDLAYKIANILETGRANELSDAINIALADKRMDEEESERRAEAARQERIMTEQAARQERIMAQQAAEQRAHNEQMQRMAQREADENRRRHEEEQRAARQAADKDAREARERERARQSRCARCVNSTKCSFKTKQLDNCGSYVPR